MITKDISLRKLLFPEDAIPDPIWRKITSRLELAAYLPNFPAEIQGAVISDLRNTADTLFHMSLLDILIGGWKSFKEVAQALDESRQKPDEALIKVLVSHTIISEHHPYIELLLNETQMGKIEFDVNAEFDVEALALKIENGHIVEIKSGSCVGSIKLAFKGETLTQMKTGRIDLPGSLDLGDTAQTKRVRLAARLVAISGMEGGHTYPLQDGLLIGHTSSCAIRLADPTVSRHHARLHLTDGLWHIKDLESETGVYVNGEFVSETVLKNGDHIRLGSTEFEFRD